MIMSLLTSFLAFVLTCVFLPQSLVVTATPTHFGNENCPKLPKLNVLPGRGWCNLRNKEMGQAQHFKYDECKTTPDGLFLIPDNAFILPISESKIQLYAEIIDSWQNYSSVTAKSININAEASFGSTASISGSFSSDYQRCKQSQMDQKSVTTRVQARYTMYTVGVSVDDEIDPKLLSQLRKAMTAIKTGNGEEVDYLLELVVREYGTHVLTRTDTGAVINQEEYITRTYREENEGSSEVIKVAASARFFSMYKFGASYSTTTNTTVQKGYEHNLRSSHTDAFGGMLFHPDTNISTWIDSIPSHPVGVDREGDPLHFIITPSTFPEQTVQLVDQLRLELQGAIGRYFSYNRHLGCMKVGAQNFDYNANIDNNMCKDEVHHYILGGVYQTCESVGEVPSICTEKGLSHKNILTQDYSCPSSYIPIRLMTRTERSCRSVKVYGWFWWWWWETHCSEHTLITYWCAAEAKGNKTVAVAAGNDTSTGLMFGGLFTPMMDNPNTQAKNCPPTFIEAKMFEDLTICIGNDYELGSRFATDFGGFFSCQIGNPLYDRKELNRLMMMNIKLQKEGKADKEMLASMPDLQNQTTKACPAGYTQHTAVIPSDCLINYCVKAGSFSIHGNMPVILPPFKNYTGIFSNGKQANSPPPDTDGKPGLVWVIGGSVFGALGFVGVLTTVVVGVRKWRRSRFVRNDDDVEDRSNLLGNNENINESESSQEQEGEISE